MAGPPRHRALLLEAIITVAAVTGALAVRLAIDPFVGDRYVFLTVLVAVIALAFWRGMRVALPALVLGVVGIVALVTQLRGRFVPLELKDGIGVGLFVVAGVLAALMGEWRWRALRRARLEQARFRALSERNPIGVWVVASDGRTADANEEYFRITGYARDDLPLRAGWNQITAPEWRARDQQALEEVRRTGRLTPYEREIICKDGARLRVLVGGGRVEGPAQEPETWLGFMIDLSERVRAERLAEHRLLELRAMYDAAPVGLCFLDRSLRFVKVNARLAALTGRAVQDYPGRTMEELWPGFPDAAAAARRAVDSGEPALDLEFEGRIGPSAGEHRRWRVSCVPAADGFGAVLGVTVVIVDLSAASVGGAGDARLATLARTVPDILFMADGAGRNTYCSPRFYEYTGLPDRAAEGEGWLRPVHADDQPRVREWWRRLVASGHPEPIEFRLRAGSADYRWFITRVRPVRDDGGTITQWCGSCTDIHDHRQAGDELRRYRDELESVVAMRTAAIQDLNRRARQAERLASLGTLASGLGHDMANLLLPIRARLEVLASLGLPAEASADLAAVETAMDHLQRLSAGMSLLSLDPGLDTASASVADLHAWWRQAEGVLRSGLPRGARLDASIAPGTPGVAMSSHRLTQAVFNLVQSAGEAMVNQPAGVVRVSADRAGPGRVRMTVRGTGPVTSPDVLPHSFEPALSAKDRTIAAGMGLSLVRGLVEGAGGTVSVLSEPGQGTSFTMVLPQATAADDSAQAVNAVVSIPRDPLSALVVMVLRGLGARVDQQEEPDGADLWIVGPQDLDRLQERLSRNPGLRAVVLADPNGVQTSAPDESRMSAVDTPGLRVMYVGAHPAAGVLRDALARVIADVRAQAGTNPSRQE